MSGLRLIKEYSIINAEILQEESGEKKWKFKGITLQAEKKNQNRRIYPANVLREAVEEHAQLMGEGRCLGELNHPEGNATSIDYKNVSHKFTKVYQDGDNFITEAEVLDTPNGKIVKSLLEAGVKLGISSRGLGSVKEKNGETLVEKLKLITFGDIVGDPSAPDAWVSGIQESFEYIMNEQGVYVRKEIVEDVAAKILKEAKKKDIQSVSIDLIKAQMKSLFKSA